MEMTVNPVCRMKIKERTITSEHGGMKYYFCSDECKTSFDANPDKYTRSQETHHNLEHNCC